MTIIHLKGREAPKAKRSAMETLIFPREEVLTWKIPPFQRAVRINGKVLEASEEMGRNGGIIPGVLTLGRLGTDKTIYLVDGQHRMEAFKLTSLPECLADARMCNYSSMKDMADDFVELNSRLVNMRPDDILRGLEESLPQLRKVRASCDFVTYNQIQRGVSHAVIGMSQLLRCWYMAQAEAPARHSPPATDLAEMLETSEADRLIVFLQIARSAWGSDPENARLWGSLNLSITMWLWRRLVLDQNRKGGKKAVVLSAEDFRKCLMAVSAAGEYVDWLVGRQIGERDRAPCYSRLRAIFAKRLTDGKDPKSVKVMLPLPSWASR